MSIGHGGAGVFQLVLGCLGIDGVPGFLRLDQGLVGAHPLSPGLVMGQVDGALQVVEGLLGGGDFQ